MADPVLRQSILLGYLMLDYDTTDELGLVDSLLVDISRGQVVGIVCQGPAWQRQRPAYDWSQITSIGADSIVLHIQGSQPPSAAAQSMVGLEVWTDMGNCVGQIVDYRFERQGKVVQYLFTRPDQPGLYGLSPDAIISAGRKRVMISAQVLAQADYFADEVIPLDSQDWQSTAQTTAQSLADQVQQRAQKLSDYAQERWLTEDLTEHLQSTTQELRSQLNQQVSNAQKRLRPLNKALENTLEKFDNQTDAPAIDLDSFEVWEDDD